MAKIRVGNGPLARHRVFPLLPFDFPVRFIYYGFMIPSVFIYASRL